MFIRIILQLQYCLIVEFIKRVEVIFTLIKKKTRKQYFF